MGFIFAAEAEKPKNANRFVDNAYYHFKYKFTKIDRRSSMLNPRKVEQSRLWYKTIDLLLRTKQK